MSSLFTEKFIRDTVLPSIDSTGGATVLTSPYGMPPALLVMDKFQPPTWVVGIGAEPERISVKHARPAVVRRRAELVFRGMDADSWSAVGFWVNDGMLYIEPVQVFTNHYMAIEAGRANEQMAIYAAHRGELEWLLPRETQVPLVPVADR